MDATLTINKPVTKWQARTVNGIFQINFDTDYRGYSIQPVFNYSTGKSDFAVFRGDQENGTMFNCVTLSSVKEWIDGMLIDDPEVFIVKTTQPRGNYTLTKFHSMVAAQLFADKVQGVIQ